VINDVTVLIHQIHKSFEGVVTSIEIEIEFPLYLDRLNGQVLLTGRFWVPANISSGKTEYSNPQPA
jgi:hypothetical protein